jgi:hypothetical protein
VRSPVAELEIHPHRLGRNEDVGEDDRRVHAEPAHRLHRHLGRAGPESCTAGGTRSSRGWRRYSGRYRPAWRMIQTGVTSTGCRRAARRIRSFTGQGRSRKPRPWRDPPSQRPSVPEDRLQIDDRRAVDRLERPDADPPRLHREHPTRCSPTGLGRFRRPGGEDAGERSARISARVDLEDRPVCLVEPGQHQELVPRRERRGGVHHLRSKLDPCIRRALVALHRRALAVAELRPHHAPRAGGGARDRSRAFAEEGVQLA